MRDPANADRVQQLLQEDTEVPAEIAKEVLAGGVFDDFSTDIDEATIERTLRMYVDLGIAEKEPNPEVSTLVRRPGADR